MSTATAGGESPALAAALKALADGLWPVVVYPWNSKQTKSPGKAPIGAAWGTERPTEWGLRTAFRRFKHANVGLKLGAEGGVIDFDVDDPDKAAPVVARIFPKGIPETFGWYNDGDRFHLMFRYDARLARYGKTIIKGGEHYPGLEIRIGAPPGDPRQLQTVVPPSVMANGRPRIHNGKDDILPVPEELLSDLDRYVLPMAEAAPEVTSGPAAASQRAERPAGNRPSAEARALAYLSRCDPAIEGQRGHDQTLKVAVSLRCGFDLTDEATLRLLDGWNQTCQPPWSEKDLARKVREAAKIESRRGWLLEAERNGHHGANGKASRNGTAKVEQPPVEPPAEPVAEERPAERPEIVITTEEHEVIDQAVAAVAGEPSVFQRCNVLVTVFRDVAAHKRREPERPVGTPRIVALPNPRLRELLAKRARWVKPIKGPGGKWDMIPAHPADWAVAGVAARGEWRSIRPIAGVVEAPTMRADGTILDAPGWDEETGLLYEPNAEFRRIPERPDLSDARRAAEVLLDLVCDFPFVDRTHAAAWLAALLTPLARFAIPGPCPLFLFDANTPGTGKSKLCDIISILATGRVSVTADYPAKEEEMAKTLLSIALAADRLVLFDNVETGFAVGGRSLDRVLTSGMTKGRVLGRLEMTPDLPVHTVFFATGNNLGLRGDALRRVVPCRVESGEERPEERQGFRYPDLLAHVLRERPRLVEAGLVLLRAYVVAGRPEAGLTPMDYPAWCGLIRNAVHWTTGLDPCKPRSQLRESDPETNIRRALVMGWQELPGSDRGVTVAEALKLLAEQPSSYDLLREALMERSRKDELPSRKSIGMWLNANKGRVVNGFALKAVDAGKNTKAWAVVAADGGTSGTSGTSRGPTREEGSEQIQGKWGNGTSTSPTSPISPTDEMPFDPYWAQH